MAQVDRLDRSQTLYIDLSEDSCVSIRLQLSKLDQLWFNSPSNSSKDSRALFEEIEQFLLARIDELLILKPNTPFNFHSDNFTIECFRREYKKRQQYVDGRRLDNKLVCILSPRSVRVAA